MVRSVLLTLAFGGLAFAFGCGDTSGPRAGLNILLGDGLSDTVGSILKPPLTVQLLDNNLQPMSGQTVYFNSGTVLVAPIDNPGFVIESAWQTRPGNRDAPETRQGALRGSGGERAK